MADEELSFLDDDPEAPEPEVEKEPEVTEQAEASEAEAEPVEVEAEGTGEKEDDPPQEAAPPVAEKESVGTVPLTVVLDEREKRQKAEAELAELRRLREQQQAQQKAPDWFEDPQAAAQFQAQTLQKQVLNTHLNQSQFLAEREFGKEVVSETEAFVRENPHVAIQFKSHPSPWHAAVEFYQRHKAMQEIGEDPEAYKAKVRDEVKAELLAGAQPAQQKPNAPPPSMASAPSAGKGDAISPGNTFDDVFPA